MTILAPTLVGTERFRALGPRHIDEIADRYGLPADLRESVRLVSAVLPFRVNEHVLNTLIDWDRIPDDPIFQLVFPQAGMLSADDGRQVAAALSDGDRTRLQTVVRDIRGRLNPHPSGQMEHNVPRGADGEPLAGVQHKYRSTVLYFPGQGQTCHSYCTYCFRWAQFVGDADLRFAAQSPHQLVEYLHRHPSVTDVLVTGGDPMVMSTERLRSHLEPLLAVPTVRTIRIGTKSLAYWPHRFGSDGDAEEVLRLFEQIVATGRNIAVMAHFSHPRELEPEPARWAMERIRATGALIYCQAPLIARVNDSAAVWREMWHRELAAGAVPYYMFVERDTGPHEYFKVPLERAASIFREAYQDLSGLARTVRGPVMSATPGKVIVDGVTPAGDGEALQLRFLQARDPALVGRPFLAHRSPTAAWLDELVLHPSTPADIAAAVGSAVSR
ncbi:lysine 2,3-aminomutase [Actinoplanes sp. SE50]|uniref:KamA family radical SAM protein n=1 Tax=unclassified Actinoplanes TaxID=2626549 RepID=UPI00023EC177|nr:MULTISPECIES: lysine 2,3-aminomutase [unclassified Actinoplanes]AEV86971.1 Lysine 2,3-aminomutase [Actinoplanes sp. SE50/110]ATO85367.1 lysine 2,3-aminomutase [Actinoplanes sp. SE50]SLM02779.1 lysine 2,3-aminomutase [Actinoplanes sp. SE50/110]